MISKNVAELANAKRMPTMLWGRQAPAGALMSYGTDFVTTYPRVAVYVDKVLKGTKPAEMPIEVVTKRELAINLKAASALSRSKM